MVLFLDEPEQIMKFSNLHQCTFNYVSVFVFSYLFVCLFHCILLSVLQKIPWRVQGPVETFSQKYVIAFFFYLDFLFRTIHRTAEDGGSYLLNSSPLLPPASQKLRQQPEDYCRELTFAFSQQPDSNQKPLAFKRKSLATKLRALNSSHYSFSQKPLSQMSDRVLNMSLSNIRRVTVAYSKLCQTSKMDHFAKVVNGIQPLSIFVKRSILDV